MNIFHQGRELLVITNFNNSQKEQHRRHRHLTSPQTPTSPANTPNQRCGRKTRHIRICHLRSLSVICRVEGECKVSFPHWVNCMVTRRTQTLVEKLWIWKEFLKKQKIPTNNHMKQFSNSPKLRKNETKTILTYHLKLELQKYFLKQQIQCPWACREIGTEIIDDGMIDWYKEENILERKPYIWARPKL